MSGSAEQNAQPAQRYAQAIDALNRSQWRQAQVIAMELLREHPGHAGVNFVAGVAALHLEQPPLASELLKRAVEMNPSRPDYLAQYARALSVGRFMKEAVEHADRAMALKPTDPLSLDTLGVVYSQAHEHGKAVEAFRAAVALVPDQPAFRSNLASSLTFAGDIAGAEREYEACLHLAPRHSKSHLALSQLRRQTKEANHLERLKRVLAQVGDDVDGQLYLNLAIAKELEDLGEYPRSFEHLSKGKAAKRATRDYDSTQDQRLFDAIRAACDALPGGAVGSASQEPIFIIGMPRSGTTLVDRILSSHSAVRSAGELQNFGTMLKRASGSQTPRMLDLDTLHRVGGIDWRQLGEDYIASTRPVTGHSPHFIDKLPHNFLYAGFIAKALPHARIICLQRDPMDTCLSNFRQLFALTSPYYDYSFDLLDTGRYYVMFEQLMAHWREVMPNRILEVRYEALVAEQEAQSRRLLAWCGLEWEDACLAFERNQAPVSTASAVQVRSPIYTSALQRWKRYGACLDDLRELLEKAGIATTSPVTA